MLLIQELMINKPYNIWEVKTHLCWSGGIDLGPGSVLLLEESGSILSDVNLGELI